MKSAYYYHHYPTSNSPSPLTLTAPWEIAATPRLTRRHFPTSASDIVPYNDSIKTPAPDYDDQPVGYELRVRSRGRNFPSEFSPSRINEMAQRRQSRSCDQLCKTEKEDDDIYSTVDMPPPLPPRKRILPMNKLLNSPSLLSDSKYKNAAIASPMTFRQFRNATTLGKRKISREIGSPLQLNRSTLNLPIHDSQYGYYERKL